MNHNELFYHLFSCFHTFKKLRLLMFSAFSNIEIFIVSAKYSCRFSNPQIFSIILADRYLDYFTIIMKDRLCQIFVKLVF